MTQFSVPWQVDRQVQYGATARGLIAIGRGIYRIFGPIIARFPGAILISAIIGVCFVVWIHALAFAYVDVRILEPAAADHVALPVAALTSPSTWGLTPSVIDTYIVRSDGWAKGAAGILKYLLWPVQFGILRDFIALGAIFGLFNIIPIYTIWWERKVAGRIQSRLGPMRVGGWHGWSQSLADGIKLMLKEDLIPKDADSILFRLAPYLAIIPAALGFVALPFGDRYVFRDLDVALVFILGVLGIEVVGVILAGWASNNKWSVYGAMREACQMVSYEIPMGMALMVPVVTAGTLSLRKIGDLQSDGWFSWFAFNSPFAFAAFVVYFIASLASCKRAPFDLPEAESELVAGFHTEYSGLRWSFFFFAEYAAMFIVGGLASILFLGAWNSPLPSSWGNAIATALGDHQVIARGINGVLFSGPIWFLVKCVFFLYVQIWLRWTLPRIRIDQVLYSCVQVMLPLTMLLLFGTTLWVWASTSSSAGWLGMARVVNLILGAIGVVFVLGFIAIAAYGFYHRRRLPGSLAVDALPGA
ncbi:MAG: NADH-quinone oxidoreductase subunit NuoH [Planctomycetes bacterium]|nr:NADH-quinone oxidoreductase subunit NuoH [Planctomycetota bacterium]